MYTRSLQRKNECICTNNMLENGLMYLYYAFCFNVMNAYITYINYEIMN